MDRTAPHITQGQQRFYYCGPAAARCALSCLGQLPSQDSLAVELHTDVDGTDSSSDIVRVMNAHVGAGAYAARLIPGRDATPAERDRLKADLVAGINAGRAIVANVVGRIETLDGKAYGYPNGHYVAIVGYRNDGAEALVADVAIPRDYWVTIAALATWIAERGYSYPVVTADTGGSDMPVIQPGAEGVDYSFQRPSVAGLVAAGKLFAGRYVGPGSGKHLDAAERDALIDAGIAIFLLAEGTADGAKGGYQVGRLHAESARTHARALGFPDTVPIYYAVDYDVTAANWAPASSYLRGACDVDGLARVGVYGDVQAMEWAQRDGVASWFFQTLSASAWSQGRVFAGNHVEQYRNGEQLGGGTVDLCRAKVADFGQWPTGHRPDDRGEDDELNGIIAQVDGQGIVKAWIDPVLGPVYVDVIKTDYFPAWTAMGFKLNPEPGSDGNHYPFMFADLSELGQLFTVAQAAYYKALAAGAAGGGGGGPVEVAAGSVAAIADATADTLAADPERDGPDS